MSSAKTKTGTLSYWNHKTKKGFGSLGRPLVVGTGTGVGAYMAGQKFDIEALHNGWTCAGIGAGTAVAAEALFHFWGDDTAYQVKDGVELIGTLAADKEWNDPATLRLELKAAGVSDANIAAVITAMVAQKAMAVKAQQPQQPQQVQQTKPRKVQNGG